MFKKKTIKITIILAGIMLVFGGGIAFYLFNMPHRNIQVLASDYKLNADNLVEEYLKDPNKANDKYLDSEGESKILEINGDIASITTDYNDQKVILLKRKDGKAGVSCTFTEKSNESVFDLIQGQNITVKGVIRSGATYDEDLEMYENVILEKCNLIK